MIHRYASVCSLIAALAGCASADKSGKAGSADDSSSLKEPTEQLAEFEDRLLNSDRLTVRFTTAATGAFTAELSGTLEFLPENHLRLDANGTFGGEPVTLRLESDGTRMTGGNASRAFDRECPKELREAVSIGLARMGILHNLARLVEGVPPDHAEGGVREWIEARNPRVPDAAESAGADVQYDLLVSGDRSADVQLRLEDDSPMPTDRILKVEFPGGSMHVKETYVYSTEESPPIPNR